MKDKFYNKHIGGNRPGKLPSGILGNKPLDRLLHRLRVHGAKIYIDHATGKASMESETSRIHVSPASFNALLDAGHIKFSHTTECGNVYTGVQK